MPQQIPSGLSTLATRSNIRSKRLVQKASPIPEPVRFRAEALGNQRDARPAFFAGRSAWDFSKRDTHFCLHKAVSLSRTLHFHRSFPLVYRDRLAISYRDHAHELLVSITPLYRKARSYELRFTARGDGIPESWMTIPLTRARPATHVDNLTPGTIYAFQVRAFGDLGFTDWSSSVTRMCI